MSNTQKDHKESDLFADVDVSHVLQQNRTLNDLVATARTAVIERA